MYKRFLDILMNLIWPKSYIKLTKIWMNRFTYLLGMEGIKLLTNKQILFLLSIDASWKVPHRKSLSETEDKLTNHENTSKLLKWNYILNLKGARHHYWHYITSAKLSPLLNRNLVYKEYLRIKCFYPPQMGKWHLVR